MWFFAEINEEVFVDFHAAVFRVTIDHHHAAAIFSNLWVELIVPSGEQRGGDIEAFAVERELDHLRPTGDLTTVDFRRFAKQATHPDLAGELWIGRISDVVLADVAVQPVAEIEKAIIHRQEDHADQARHGDRPFGMAFVFDVYDFFLDPFAVILLVPVDDV